jgi:hypothetical protein
MRIKTPSSDFLCLLAILLLAICSASCNPRNEQYQCACTGYGITGTDTNRFVVNSNYGDDPAVTCQQAASTGTTPLKCWVE